MTSCFFFLLFERISWFAYRMHGIAVGGAAKKKPTHELKRLERKGKAMHFYLGETC